MKEYIPQLTNLERWQSTLDRTIVSLFPRWGARRMAARAAISLFSAYHGANKSRLRSNWSPVGGSPDADLLPDLPTLRERSRDLNRNNALASAITSTITINVVGTGIKPQCRLDREVLGLAEDQAREYEKAAERAWRRWLPYADSQNRMDFYDIQHLIQRQILENGEVLMLPLMIQDEPWRPYQLALEVIEADRLETPMSRVGAANLRDGVELGSRGQPIAYWIRRHHPGDLTMPGIHQVEADDFIRYPARNKAGRENVFHLYWQKRPGQSRGEPFFAPAMSLFKDLADYREAKLVSARVAACFAAFIKKTDPYGAMNANTTTNSKGQRVQELEPGMLEYLAPGEDVVFANPNNPGGDYALFTEDVSRTIGAALGLPIELVTKNFSKTNYSSARAAMLEARRFFRGYQQWLATTVCQPTYELLIEEAWLKEELPAVNLFTDQRDEYLKARWVAPGWGWVDPVKEVESSTLAINAGLSTLAEECASQGRDWEENLEQQKREQDKRTELDLDPVTPPKPAPGTPAPQEGEEEEEEEEKEPANA